MRRLQTSAKAFWWIATLAATINNNGGSYFLLLLCSTINSVNSKDHDESAQLEIAYIKLEGEECIPVQDTESSGRVMKHKASAARSAHLAVSSDTSMKPDVGILGPFKRQAERRLSPGRMSTRRRRNRPSNDVNSRNEKHNVSPDVGILKSHICEGSLECAKDGSSLLGGRCVPKKQAENEMGSRGNRRGLQTWRDVYFEPCLESCPSMGFCQCRYGSGHSYEVCFSYIDAICANKQYHDACFVFQDYFFVDYYCDGNLFRDCLESCPSATFCQCWHGCDDNISYEVCLPYIVAVCANEQLLDACIVEAYDNSDYFCDNAICRYEGGPIQKDCRKAHRECLESCPSVALCQCLHQYDAIGFFDNIDDFFHKSDDIYREVCLSTIASVCADEQLRDACLTFTGNKECNYYTCRYEGGSIRQCQCWYYCDPDLCNCLQTDDFDPACVDPVADMCNWGLTYFCSYDSNVFESTSCPLYTCLASGQSEAVCRCVASKSSCNYFKLSSNYILSSRQKAQYYCAVADCCSKAKTDEQRYSCFFKDLTTKRKDE